MDSKIKLLAVVSVIAVMTSGCSRLGSGTSQNTAGGYSSGGTAATTAGTGQVARTGQVSRGGLFGQRKPAATCAPCAANASKNTYTYKPATKPVYKAETKPAGQHNQQYYIDKWNREQTQQKNKNTQNYTGYGNTGASSATYYDYSSAGKNTAGSSVSTSNKSIYTGSYQQPTYKPYQPTTYAGGSTGTTNTASTYSGSTTKASTGGSTYIVKKGDTVFEVMRQTGVYWKDIISMNNLVSPAYTINPGQTLRLK